MGSSEGAPSGRVGLRTCSANSILKMPKENLYCLILAGGRGTRLWPLSRRSLPKQFLSLNGNESLLLGTLRRAARLVAEENILVVLEEKQRSLIEDNLRYTDFSGKIKIVTEPVGRNTAPAILLGTLGIASEDEDAVIMVFPSDHVVGDDENFRDHVRRAVSLAEDGYIVCFGITPSVPETGYGYIEGGGLLRDGGLRIKRFVEKPSAEVASEYLLSGNFFWNSGMFVFRARTMIEEYAALCPEVYEPICETSHGEVERDVYAGLPSVPVDRAVMEKTSRGAVIPSSFSWSDIGSWRLFYEFFPKDCEGNVLEGDVILRGTEDSIVKSGSRLVCVSGLRNVAVIETKDAVFISDLDRSNEAGEFAKELRERGRGEADHPEVVHYPWGSREEIEKGEFSKVIKTTVLPGKSVRTENMPSENLRLLVLEGEALIISEEGKDELGLGQTILFEDGTNCAVENKTDDILVILEVFSVID